MVAARACAWLLAVFLAAFVAAFMTADPARAQSLPRELIFDPGQLKPTDSTLKVKVGDKAPDFDLPAASGGRVSLSQYLGKKNIVLSFIPAAWTPVCSGQWPGYDLAREVFEKNDAVIVGISCDHPASQHAWVTQMGGLWFPVASDFWPHGKLAATLGVLRGDGMAERSLFVIDKKGVIRFITVNDINTRPDLGALAQALAALQ